MNKPELINIVAENYEKVMGEKIAKKRVEGFLKAFADAVLDNTVAEDDRVPFAGVGMFKTRFVPERTGVNTFGDGTKEWVSPAHNERVFKFTESVKKVDIAE